MWDDLAAIDPRFAYKGERTRYIAFPLGGIGAGGLSISGSGRLVDWSIRNRPALQGYNGYSHFAIKAERDGKLIDARVLNGPYDLNPSGAPGLRKMFDGFGHGANRQTLVGVPHFREVDFYGRFPTADLVFRDDRFPGGIRLTTLSPFIPHNDHDSSMPVAMFEVELVNDTSDELTYTLAGTLGNYGSNSGIHTYSRKDGVSTLHLTSSDETLKPKERGDLTIATDADDVDHTDHHYRGQWFDDLAVFWKDFARAGRLPERHYDKPRTSRHMSLQPEHGTLAARVTIPAGGRKKVRFVISWNFPVGDIYWAYRSKPDGVIPDRETPTWRNYYAIHWADSEASARDALRRWDRLAGDTIAFRDSLFGSTLPAEIKDAASSTLALLRTATVIRLEGGEIWGWEGQHREDGSCEGSCTHVWNYQQAVSHLFPALERTLRETEFTYNQLPNGGLTFRQKLPLGSGFDVIGPCADGHFGAVIKTYRDWKLSGDTEWLRRWWPHVKRAIEYAWSKDNPDRWDPDETGVLSGRQHQTLDMELFNPNSWLGSMYVAALLAASEMASALGEKDFAVKCGRLGRNGAKYIDEKLFNGRWFIQDIDLSDKSVLTPFDVGRAAGVLADGFMETYWSDEHSELKYQMGEGCITDQILGQWHAEVAGIGGFLDDGKVETALKSVHGNNFRRSLQDHFNPCRNYAFEDEGGLLVATYPEGVRQPMVAAPYAEEVWTGIEYMSASHMIMRGLVDEGLEVVRAARDRHDGSRRNPWNDIECGSYYARSMSAWQLVNAWSGLSADLVAGRIGFAPNAKGDCTLFWSAGNGFGELIRKGEELRFMVVGGSIEISEIAIAGLGVHRLPARRSLRQGEALTLQLTPESPTVG
ncbi:GH116 family glycosyl-hydrolase [Mesorhizobium sp. BAC0120]|uniref:GH116 family glycosyl-hydrolase n=1 Tax=Mesorhizobium sp. BAC0120 TaxID=3090670 RepID=UPI00298C3E74|nr:GH116 family glycosyl-hydrolase [Mesorhizobium sp. BAC0120]MDW6025796.1 GH116 family glycosyl-hydrolase [Mesorhizobium sp. BAC0120]